MQKRVKTYGKHSSRIITVSDEKSIAIPHNTVTLVTQPTFNNHVSLSESSDDAPTYQKNSSGIKTVPDPKGKITTHRRPHDPIHKDKASRVQERPQQKGMDDTLKRAGVSRYDAGSVQHQVLGKPSGPARSVVTKSHISKPINAINSRGDKEKHSTLQRREIELSDSTNSIPVAKPSARVTGARRKYVASDSSETSSFESTSDAEEPDVSSSSDSPSPTARTAPKAKAASSPSRSRIQRKAPVKNVFTEAPPTKSLPITSSLKLSVKPGQKGRAIEISSESEASQGDTSDSQVAHETHEATQPFTGTPQVKASHLRQARFQKGTPFRRVPRISLASTLTLSPISPLNFPSKKRKAVVPMSTIKPLKLDSPPSTPLPPSSPLTWNESLTPEAVRNRGMSSDDEEQSSTAMSLKRLLNFAGQSIPVDFTTFLETFRTQDIEAICASEKRDKVRNAQRASMKYRKVGDASYSEVFAIGDLVLKVIPLAVEIDTDNSEDSDEDKDEGAPFRSSPENVLKEIMITKATGDAVDGFIKLLRTYIVKGKYPRPLLKEWDEFNRNRGSDGIRPDSFTENQLYAVVVLPNGGIDLETYVFSKSQAATGTSKGGTAWRDAAEVFWQVTTALAAAEEQLKFEHRDLHWGQIVVRKSTPANSEKPVISATIIDLGLSRIATEGAVQFTSFEEDMFTGAGILPGSDVAVESNENLEPDYQFDIYRLMRHYNGDDWVSYRPLTNVMVGAKVKRHFPSDLRQQWLHYLSVKLLRHKGLRKPSSNARPSTIHANSSTELPHLESEWHAHQQLIAVEQCLGSRLEEIVKSMVQKQGKGKHSAKAKKQTRPTKAAADPVSKKSAISIESVGDVAVLWLAKAW